MHQGKFPQKDANQQNTMICSKAAKGGEGGREVAWKLEVLCIQPRMAVGGILMHKTIDFGRAGSSDSGIGKGGRERRLG